MESPDVLVPPVNEQAIQPQTVSPAIDTFTQMKTYLEGREPGLLQYFQDTKRPRDSAILAIDHAENPRVKADLVRIVMNERLQHGSPSSAVQLLERARAAELYLPEYGSDFVDGLYTSCIAQGDHGEAWSISLSMAGHSHEILPSESEAERKKNKDDWNQKELDSLGAYGVVLANMFHENPDLPMYDAIHLKLVFDSMMIRKSERQPQVPPEMYDLITRAWVQYEVNRGRVWPALYEAIEAELPDDVIDAIKTKIPKDKIDTIRGLAQKMQSRLAKILSWR